MAFGNGFLQSVSKDGIKTTSADWIAFKSSLSRVEGDKKRYFQDRIWRVELFTNTESQLDEVGIYCATFELEFVKVVKNAFQEFGSACRWMEGQLFGDFIQ